MALRYMKNRRKERCMMEYGGTALKPRMLPEL